MIQKNEIEAKAKEFQIHPANVERDYVFGWLLAGIYTVSELRGTLILKGGNCFRKAYFPATRFSHDLDFSTESAVDQEMLVREFTKVCRFVESEAGVVFEADRMRIELQNEIDARRKVYEVRLYFKDFYGNPEKFTISVSLDIMEFDRIYLPPQNRTLIHPYSDADACKAELRCVKLEELLASKLKCLLQRQQITDLYDLAYSVLINRDIAVDRPQVVSTFLRKTIFEPDPRAAKQLLLDLPLHAMKEAWTKYIVCPIQSVLEWDSTLQGFLGFVEALFAGYGPAYGTGIAYFPSSFRNAIMDAGSKRQILKLTYDGVTRLVEPYSLVYKRRQDGHGQEYLYVYDRTGGRQTGPGIKSMIHAKIQAIEPTAETFEPRFPIELSRAGEFSGRTYFGSPFGGQRARSRSSSPRGTRVRRSRVPGWKYVYRCAYCNRRFTRSTRTDRLKPHKDGYGNNCYGRRGYLVDQQYR